MKNWGKSIRQETGPEMRRSTACSKGNKIKKARWCEMRRVVGYAGEGLGMGGQAQGHVA